MNKLLKPTILFLVVLSLGCQNGNLKKLKPSSDSSIVAYKFIITDTINIDIGSSISNSFLEIELKDDSLLYVLDYFNQLKCLFVLNINKRNIENKICVQQDYLLHRRINKFYVHNKDSIFCLENYPPNLLLINNVGTVINTIDFDNIKNNDSVFQILENYGYGILRIDYYDKSKADIYFTLVPGGDVDFIGEKRYYRHAIFNIDSKSWGLFYGKYEGVLKRKGSNIYFYDMHNPYSLIRGQFDFISYPVDNYVYRYDLNTGVLEDSILFSGNTKIVFPDPLPKNSSDKKIIELRNNTPFYGPLNFHGRKKLFSRYCNFEGKRLFLLFDSNFELVAELSFSPEIVHLLIPTDFGFYSIPKIDTTIDENILPIYKFEIIEDY